MAMTVVSGHSVQKLIEEDIDVDDDDLVGS
jgi:hypothetical protein